MAYTKRKLLSRKAKTKNIKLKSEGELISFKRTPDQLSEKDIDDQKHGRAMDLLYRLQQRQEQISVTLYKDSSHPLLPDDMVENELEAVEEALHRLTKVFKLAKEELNDSQYFPTSSVTAEAMQRKQVQINARLTKCAQLSKAQNALTEKYAELKKEESQNTTVSTSCSTCSESSADDSSMTFCEETSNVESSSSSSVVKDLPFSQPVYSQCSLQNQHPSQALSAAQSFLDDLLGGDNNNAKSSEHPAEQTTGSSVIACCNGKMFASPPRSAISQTLSTHAQPNDSSNSMDITGIFEPSYKDNTLPDDFHHQLDNLIDSITKDGNFPDLPRDTSTQVEPLKARAQPVVSSDGYPDKAVSGSTIVVDVTGTPQLANSARRKFVLASDVKVELLSNNELCSIQANATWDRLSQEVIDTINCWD